MINIPVGATSRIIEVNILDTSKTDGSGLTGLAYNSAGLTAYYKRNTGSASVEITLATITTLGVWETGGFREVDADNMPGLYELHIPDAVLASGATSAYITLKGATNMAQQTIGIDMGNTAIDDIRDFFFGIKEEDLRTGHIKFLKEDGVTLISEQSVTSITNAAGNPAERFGPIS